MEENEIDSNVKEKEQSFNHQNLIMKCMQRISEFGSKELHEGNDIQEIIDGKIVLIHRANERKQFINSIEIAIAMMICDFDEEVENSLKELQEGINELKDNLLEEQFKFYKEMSQIGRQNLNLFVIHRKVFTDKLPFIKRFKEEELIYYRKVLKELVLLTERLGFYDGFDNQV